MRIDCKHILIFRSFVIRLLIFIGVFIVNAHQKTFAQNTEICDNAMDDDQDGLIDLNDPDCNCPVLEPISRIPNPSFEETNCCPDNRSQLNCANGWIQASGPTTDLIHECDWFGWPEFPPPVPFPDGKGVVGFRDGRVRRDSDTHQYGWKEYAGACLIAPLISGETYRFEFDIGFVNTVVSPRIPVTFFGAIDCKYLPFGIGDNDTGCPTVTEGWIELGDVEVQGNNEWIKSRLDVTPKEDIYAIAIGPSCSPTIANVSTYYFFDNLLLDEKLNFDLKITTSVHPCRDNFSISIPEVNDVRFQWYKDGIALIGENDANLNDIDEGNYQVMLTSVEGCKVSAAYNYTIPVLRTNTTTKICDGSALRFGTQTITESGIFEEKFVSVHGCDSIVNMEVVGLTTLRDTMNAKIFEGEKFIFDNRSLRTKGEHVIALTDADGCDYFVHINLDFFEVYFPNIFSPNGDGRNDFFNVYGGSDLVMVKELLIYNRWGGLVYKGQDLLPNEGEGWDGKMGGRRIGSGIYIFKATLVMIDGTEKDFYDSVMVVE